MRSVIAASTPGRVYVPSVWINVHENRLSADPEQGVDGGHEGKGRDDDLALEAQAMVGEEQTQSAGGDGHSMFYPQVFSYTASNSRRYFPW